ncbi:hypothetical protein SeMB42_g06009 [Synchytrium endobioticum]|uniref:Matrin-type domain-containing protein n=1 Tax=Synchytrium endobioticum TaxID=286115 RepID=A0A507CKQ7_9FUNG|nr:hypothetical protein SeMB42_g06009 [Synchytrium endobioticum]TPX48903.1 hypothetical protein SeLEV6574_g01783 [Synchytrium endobioticum]
MDSLLEQQRRAHEEIERLENVGVQELLNKPKTQKERVVQERRVSGYIDRIADKSKFLYHVYQDTDDSRKNEIAAISGATDFSEFYQRLRAIKDYHRRYPNEGYEPFEAEFINRDTEKEAEELEACFTGEEALGKYLDLHVRFEQFLNLKGVKREKGTYLSYLNEFDKFEDISKETRSAADYSKYIADLRAYLEGFFKRSQPLFDIGAVQAKASDEFDPKWEAGEVPGWDLNANEDDESLYCVACAKQFAKRTVYDAHLTGKKHIKAAENLVKQGTETISSEARTQSRFDSLMQQRQRNRPIAYSEFLIKAYMHVLNAIREETRGFVERKQTLTERERLAETLEEVELNEEDIDGMNENEDEEKIYNPLKLPLGWDGKPIPYWLYKLHGLGVEYPCEICGNFVYMGRKAFERHFQEARHAHGMKSLGIPNTRQFHEITSIQDAIGLWEKVRNLTKKEELRNDGTEEFEDSSGNVFSKKVYDDLKRQGLL